jgi:hypothetical protein
LPDTNRDPTPWFVFVTLGFGLMILPVSLPKNECKALRIRVERLLRGDSNPDDLTALFLALRDFSGGRECVMEIGNFIAHRGERYVGITTEEARGFFATVRFLFPEPKQINLSDLPVNFSELLVYAFRRTGNSQLKSQLRLKRQIAERKLNQLRERIQADAYQRLFLAWPTDEDRTLIQCLLGHVTARPAFTDERLIDELTAALHANGLLHQTEMKAFRKFKTFVALFAISKMHQCMIDLGDGTQAELLGGATHSNIEVNAAAELFGVNPTGRVLISSTFFHTSVDVMEYAEPELHPPSAQEATWKCAVELTSAGKLKKLA